MRSLRLAERTSLPFDAATQTFLIVGKRGSGKSSTGTRLAEQMIRTGIPIAVLDPADVWWGLKAGRDGTPVGGLGVYVFGGGHADIPLEPTAGTLMADVLVDHRVSAVFVLRAFSNREKARFVADFADRLYRRMVGEFVLHLFCEEAHELMPQQPYGGEEEMLGRMLRLEKQGRTGGIGMSAITQRPASLNKNATTQAEILISHRLLGPQDITAVEGWIKHHHVEEKKQEVLSTLPELKTGEAWLWAPDFPEEEPLGLRRIKVCEPETFDSRRTPTPGERRPQPTALAPVDLEKLRSKMAATIERAKAEDPRELQGRVRTLQAQLVGKETELSAAAQTIERLQRRQPRPAKERRVEVPVVKPADVRRLEAACDRAERAGERARAAGEAVAKTGKDVRYELQAVLSHFKGFPPTLPQEARSPVIYTSPPTRELAPHGAAAGTPGAQEPGRLGVGERLILTAVAQHPEGVTRKHLTVLTGYRASSRNTYLQRLRQADCVTWNGDRVLSSMKGRAALGGDYAPLPTGKDLVAHWLAHLPEGERRIFAVLVDAYPRALERREIDDKTGYKPSSRNTYLQRLRARELVEVGAGDGDSYMRASKELFP